MADRTSDASTPAELIAAKIVRDVAELPDRTSPEDWPDAMIVTADELEAIVLAALAIATDVARTILEGDS